METKPKSGAKSGFIRRLHFFVILAACAHSPCAAQALPSDPLSRGMAFYRENKDKEALAELRRAIVSGHGRALAYYYSARIRNRMEQPSTARNNLLAALNDSADFHDAIGLLAWTNMKLGNTTDALIEWRRFVEAAGEPPHGEKEMYLTILLPEEYRARLARAHADSAKASAVVNPDSAFTGPEKSEKPDAGDLESAKALGELDRRISAQIRRGYYSAGAAASILIAGIVFAAWLIRKRMKRTVAPDFLAEVGRMLDEREEAADEFSLDEEALAEQKRLERVREQPAEKQRDQISALNSKTHDETLEKSEGLPILTGPESRQPEYTGPAEEESGPVFDDSGIRELFQERTPEPGQEPERGIVTEEVKSLVVRLHREGRSTVDIARLSELTRTEVDLILAVRAREVENIVETVREEWEGETTVIHRAVAELAAEGCGIVEIARRLGISRSEASLALEVIKNWKKEKKR